MGNRKAVYVAITNLYQSARGNNVCVRVPFSDVRRYVVIVNIQLPFDTSSASPGFKACTTH